MNGIEIFTDQNKLFLGIDEDTYMYWGKVTVSGTSKVKPFNIPTSVDIEVYYYCNQTGVYLEKSSSSGYHTLEVKKGVSGTNTATAYAYIFMSPKDIPVEGYGLAIYKENGELQWHSASPPLSFSHLVSGLSTSKDSSQTTSSISAVRVTALGFQRVVLGGGETDLWVRHLSASSVSGTNKVSVVGKFMSTEDDNISFSGNYDALGASLYLGCIDVAYYNSITNKGNY